MAYSMQCNAMTMDRVFIQKSQFNQIVPQSTIDRARERAQKHLFKPFNAIGVGKAGVM